MKSQVWVAVSVYVLLAIIKRELKCDDRSLAEIQQIFSVTLFEKVPISQAFAGDLQQFRKADSPNQLQLFDL